MHQLNANVISNVVNIKSSCFIFHLRMKHNLKHYVTKFFPKQFIIMSINCFNHLIGFFNKIFSNTLVGLFSVPRTSSFTTKYFHNQTKVIEIIFCF